MEKVEVKEEEIEQNVQDQDDEISVLETMFDEGKNIHISKPRIHLIFHKDEDNDKSKIELDCILLQSYPSHTPPRLRVSSSFYDISNLEEELLELFIPGSIVIYDWISHLETVDLKKINKSTPKNPKTEPIEFDKEIFVSETFSLKKSKFVGHGCNISTPEEARTFLRYLKQSNSKIEKATHNMYAYRIRQEEATETRSHRGLRMKGVLRKAYDGGEKRGGDVILDCLDFRDSIDIMIIVTRWYGGVHLGGARFKVIKNVTIDVIDKMTKKV